MGPGPAQPLFEKGTGSAGSRNDQTGGMELDHFHVHHFRPRPVQERDPIRRLVQGRRKELVHGRAASGADHGRAGMGDHVVPRSHVQKEGAHDPGSGFVPEKLQGPVLFHVFDVPPEYLLRQAGDDFDPGQIPFVNGAVEALPGKGLLVDGSVRVAVKEAAVFRFHLLDPVCGHGHQFPSELLVVDELAAFEGVHEMFLMGIGRVENHIVSALDHARTPALADDRLGHQENFYLLARVGGMEGGAEPGAPRPQDEDIGFDHGNISLAHFFSSPQTPKEPYSRRTLRSTIPNFLFVGIQRHEVNPQRFQILQGKIILWHGCSRLIEPGIHDEPLDPFRRAAALPDHGHVRPFPSSLPFQKPGGRRRNFFPSRPAHPEFPGPMPAERPGRLFLRNERPPCRGR